MAKEIRKVHISVSSNASKELNKGTASAKGLSGALRGVSGAAGVATGGIRSMTAALMSSGVGLFVVAIGSLVGAFGSIISKSSEFEKALSTLQAVTGSSSSDIGELSDLAKELGSTTAFTASQVVELQTELAKLGFKTDDIKNATGSILDLAASLDVGLGEAAEFSGSLVKSFGLTTEETSRVVDVMAKSTSSSALNFESLRESLKLVAPVSKATGVSIETTTALLGVLADRGLKGSIAGTGLAKTFIMLNKKGISLAEGMKRVKESADPLNTAIDLVGVVAGKTFLTLADGQNDIAGLETSFINAEGAAQKMAEIKLDNLQGDTTKLASAWEGLLLSIEDGQGVLSSIARGFVQFGTDIVNFLTPQKDATKAIKDQQAELFKLESQLLNTNTSEEERRKVIIKLKKEYPDYLAHLDTEKTTNKELSAAISKVNDNLVNKIILARKDQEIQEQAENVADETLSKLEREDKLRTTIANNRIKYGFQATEGTLLEQAEAQRLLIKEEAVNMSISDKQRAYRGLRDGVTLLTKATESLNKEQGKQSEMLSEQDALYSELGIKRVDNETDVVDKVVGANKTGGETITEDQQAELDKQKQNKDTFLAKLKKLEQDSEDETQLEKIQRKRERHLKDLDSITMTTTERREAEKTINAIYDIQRDEQIDKNNEAHANKLKGFLKQFGVDNEDPDAALNEAQEKHLRELDQLKLNETEKAEAVKAINAFYDSERATLKQNKRDEDAEKDAAELAMKKQLLSDGLDLAIEASGEESKIGKALLKIKQAFALAEMLMKMRVMAMNLKTKAKEGIASTSIASAEQSASIGVGVANSAKSGFPFNVIPLALMAAQGVMMVQNMAKSKKEMQQATAGLGGGGMGGSSGATTVRPPNFNVIGQASTGENLIADTIAGANNRPIRAYVVGKDVTTSQELERNTEDSASIG